MKKEKSYKVVSYALPKDIVAKIEKLSKDNGWTKSMIVKNGLRAFFGK